MRRSNSADGGRGLTSAQLTATGVIVAFALVMALVVLAPQGHAAVF